MLQRLSVAALLAIAGLGLYVAPAYAYLDPGSGSMILHMIVGALVAIAASLKFFWHSVVGFVTRLLPTSSSRLKNGSGEAGGKK